MNKKKKKIIRISIILGVIVAAAIIILISYGNRKAGAMQFEVENHDEMEFNPFMSTENRLDNSLLEYGKVLTKYEDKGYTDYTGEDIVVDMSAVSGAEGSPMRKTLKGTPSFTIIRQMPKRRWTARRTLTLSIQISTAAMLLLT